MAEKGLPTLLGSEYRKDVEVNLLLKEEWMVQHGGFPIKDTIGKEEFRIENSFNTHSVIDAYDRRILKLVRKCAAWTLTYHIYSGDTLTERRATVKLAPWKCNKVAWVYTYSPPYPTPDDPTDLSVMKPAFMMQASTCGNMIKDVEITNPDTGEVYATMNRAKAKELFPDCPKRHYALTVKSGVDYAFMTACAVLFNSMVKQESNNN